MKKEHTMRKAKINLGNDKLKVSAEVLRALAHPLRMKILEFIDRNESTHVNKIYNTLNLEQSITSQHLRILRNAELVHTRREGKFIYYSINYDKIGSVNGSIQNFLQQ